ncbi:MAG TPA: hypothetical protein VK996_16210 [Ramlibacter sp.]|nr:hypothetical protein [Ramlibacter sp.]
MVLPELGAFPAPKRRAAFEKAGETELDILELLGVALALVLVTVATRYALADQSLPSRAAAAALNFIVAVPLIAMGVTPFHIRRLRRGLRAQLEQLDQEHD